MLIGRGIDGNFYFIEEHAHQFKFIDDWVVIAKDIVSRYGNINFTAILHDLNTSLNLEDIDYVQLTLIKVNYRV